MLSQALRKFYVKEADLEKAIKRGKAYLGNNKYLHARKSGRTVNWVVSKDESGNEVLGKGSEFM